MNKRQRRCIQYVELPVSLNLYLSGIDGFFWAHVGVLPQRGNAVVAHFERRLACKR